MKTMHKTVSDTKQSLAVNADRSARRNNLVIYNFPEDDKDTKSKAKDSCVALLFRCLVK